jgi:hypothetical protein
VWRRGRRRGLATVVGTAAASAVAVTGVVVAEHGRGRSASPAVATTPAPACDGTPRTGVLSGWARTGFSDPQPVVPFVRSRSGNVVAILFGGQLRSPPRKDNKILWVWRQMPGGATGDVRMTAQLVGTDTVVTTGLPRPEGPSAVDLPAPGCWRITLHSPRRADTLDLDYARP